jgi:energy-coupling factor transporter ATP-binding protein EcfA2
MLCLKRIYYTYPGSSGPAIQDVNLKIQRGLNYCVLGPDTSGKSTLCKVIASILKPDSGQIIQDDENGGLESAAGFYIGGDPYDCIVGVTLQDDMEFALRNLGLSVSQRRARMEVTLSKMGIGHLKDRPIHTLSGGEQQKAAMATGLAMRRRLMIIDESMNMLDQKNRAELRSAFKMMGKDFRATIVQASNDPMDLFEADRAVFMNKGRPSIVSSPMGFAKSEIGRRWLFKLGGIWRILAHENVLGSLTDEKVDSTAILNMAKHIMFSKLSSLKSLE